MFATEYGVFALGEAAGERGECIGFVRLTELPAGGWRLTAHPEGVFRYALDVHDRGEADAHVMALTAAEGFMRGAIADLHARRPDLAHDDLAGAYVIQSVRCEVPPPAAGDPEAEAEAGDAGSGDE